MSARNHSWWTAITREWAHTMRPITSWTKRSMHNTKASFCKFNQIIETLTKDIIDIVTIVSLKQFRTWTTSEPFTIRHKSLGSVVCPRLVTRIPATHAVHYGTRVSNIKRALQVKNSTRYSTDGLLSSCEN